MPLSYPEAFELSVELHIAKFTGRHLSQDSLVEVFPRNFAKLLRTPILKNISERLFLAAGWRTTYKLNRRDLILLLCLVYINISVGSFLFFHYDFFMHICFGF